MPQRNCNVVSVFCLCTQILVTHLAKEQYLHARCKKDDKHKGGNANES